MVVSAKGFVFADKTSDDFNLLICEFEGTSVTDTSSGDVEFSLVSSPIQNKWFKSGNSTYTEAIKFGFSVAKKNFMPIDTYEYSSIARWLERKDDYKDFLLTRSDYDNIHFFSQLNVSPIEVNGDIMGINITGITNAPFGYAPLSVKTFDTDDGNEFTFIDLSDEIGYIYPDLEITIKNNCDLSITNLTENRTFVLRNCVANEIITINGSTLQINTTAISHNLYSDTNYQFLRIINDYDKRKNVFRISGDCIVKMTYRPIRKVVL